MAISKVVYKSSANATPEVWMDATTATAAAADITAPKTAMLADGVMTTGTGSGGGGGLEYEQGAYTPTEDVAIPTISFSDNHTIRPYLVMIWDTAGTAPESNSCQMWSIVSWYDVDGSGIIGTTGGSINYARVQYSYWSTSTSSVGTNINTLTGNITNSFEYYISSSAFMPYSGSTSRYWRSGRTYKWIAVWTPTT